MALREDYFKPCTNEIDWKIMIVEDVAPDDGKDAQIMGKWPI